MDDSAKYAATAIEPEEPMLRYFNFDHFPPEVHGVSGDFMGVAYSLVAQCPRNPERTVMLRKLLEARDCAVRAIGFK